MKANKILLERRKCNCSYVELSADTKIKQKECKECIRKRKRNETKSIH